MPKIEKDYTKITKIAKTFGFVPETKKFMYSKPRAGFYEKYIPEHFETIVIDLTNAIPLANRVKEEMFYQLCLGFAKAQSDYNAECERQAGASI